MPSKQSVREDHEATERPVKRARTEVNQTVPLICARTDRLQGENDLKDDTSEVEEEVETFSKPREGPKASDLYLDTVRPVNFTVLQSECHQVFRSTGQR